MSTILPVSHPIVRAEDKISLYSRLKSLVEKVIQVSSAVFRALFDLVTFPLRYMGSKTWSFPGLVLRFPFLVFKRIIGIPCEHSLKKELFGAGYHFQFEKTASKEELKGHLPYLAAAAFIHASEPYRIESFGYRVISPKTLKVEIDGIESREHCFFDPVSGLKMGLIEKGDHIVVVFGAINSSYSELQNLSDAKWIDKKSYGNITWNLLGGIPSIYWQANQLFEKVQNHPHFKRKRLELAGQCYGGSIAEFLALKHKITALCINSVPIGPGLQKVLGAKALMNADEHIISLSVKEDFVSDSKVFAFIDPFLNGLGVRTAGNFGRRFVIPSAYTKRADTHNNALGSALKYLGIASNKDIKNHPEFSNITGKILPSRMK